MHSEHTDINGAFRLFSSLGFKYILINPLSCQNQTLPLGFNTNSRNMKVSLTNLSCKPYKTIHIKPRYISQIIGLILSSLPEVKYGLFYYMCFDKDEVRALKESKGLFDAKILVSRLSLCQTAISLLLVEIMQLW